MTVSKYMRREAAQNCPVHQLILELCETHLADCGYFNKQEIVEEAGFPPQLGTDYLRWDYIADFIKKKVWEKDAEGTVISVTVEKELVPLAARFWKMKPHERVASPEQAIALGHGKKTAGYALVDVDDGALAVKRLEQRRSTTNGLGKAFRKYADELIKRNLLQEPDNRKLADTITN